MKLITLNTWGGRAGKDKLLGFFDQHRDIDIFCLQEIWSDQDDDYEGQIVGGLPLEHSNIMVYGLQEITALLDTHTPYFRPHFTDDYGLLIMIKKSIKVIDEGEVYVHKHKGYQPKGDVGRHARNVQYITIATEHGQRTVMNFHGLWNGRGKGDSADRLRQSDKIIQFLKTLDNPFVLCGDFNLLPSTASLKMLEDFGLRNLIAEHNIRSTRTSHYQKPDKFADYIFTGGEVEIRDYAVLPDEVSDHSPLYLEFT